MCWTEIMQCSKEDIKRKIDFVHREDEKKKEI